MPSTLASMPLQKPVVMLHCLKSELNARLADVGMLPGTVWQMVAKIPFSGPVVISNGNMRISLREEDAREIVVESKSE